MIQLFVNSTNIELAPGESITLKKANAQLSQIGSRGGAFTNDFDIRMSASNLAAFGYVHILQSDNDFEPEKKQDAHLERETGGQIAVGFVQVVSVDIRQKRIKVAFFASNAGWIEAIRGKSIRDVWLRDYDHTWNEAGIVASWSNTAGYIYPFIDYGKWTDTGTPLTEVEDWFPCVYQHTLITRMFEVAGWKAAGNFIDTWEHKHTVVAHVADTFFADTNLDFEAEADWTGAKTYTAGWLGPASASDSHTADIQYLTVVTDPEGAFTTPPAATYTAVSNLTDATFKGSFFQGESYISIDSANNTTGTITLEIQQNGTPIASQVINTLTVVSGSSVSLLNTDYFISHTFDVTAADVITFNVKFAFSGADIGVTNLDFQFTHYTQFKFELLNLSTVIANGGTVTLANNLPDISQVDFVKDMIMRHGLLVTTDEYSQTVYFNRFDPVVQNSDQATDWTDKVNLIGVSEINFEETVSNYGRKTWFRYKPPISDDLYLDDFNNEKAIPFGDGYLEIDNDFLPNEVDIYTSPFSATYQERAAPFLITLGYYIPYIPKTDTAGTAEYRPNPRILFALPDISVSDFAISNSTVSIEGTTYTETGFAYFVKPLVNSDLDNLRPSLAYTIPDIDNPSGVGLLDWNYGEWHDLLSKPRYVTVGLKLFPHEFQDIDLSLPVYIDNEEIRGYFLIDEIEYSDGGDIVRLIQLQ